MEKKSKRREVIKNHVYIECMFCQKTITGRVKRMKEHLACTHKNVGPCPGVPMEVKEEIAEYMNAGNMKRHLSQQQFEDMVEVGSYYEKDDKEKDSMRGIRGPMDRFVSNIGGDGETNLKMSAAKMKEMRNCVCLDVGRFFFENAIPFNVVESPSFISMCRALGSYGRGFQPPTMYELRTWILKEEAESTGKIVDDVKATWTQFGVGTPVLTKFATRVLSLTCSSSACERNWSTFNLVHTKRRNRLTTKRLHTLVYINYNKKLKNRHRRLKSLKEGENPLILKEVPSDDEWIADHDIGAPSNTCDVNDDDSSLNLSQSKGIESSTHTQSQPIRKRTFSRKGKKNVTLLVDEEDDFVEIESSEEEDDGKIRYDDDSIDDASNSDDIADN